MGICDSEPKYRINEVLIKNSNLKPIDKNIIKVSPSVCKISTDNIEGTGFLIKLKRNNNLLFCLMTNEHVLKREMVENKETINIKYDCETKEVNIQLDSTKRIIRDFININEDIMIVEILPKDNIEAHYFLEPELNHIQKLKNNPIYIPQYPGGSKFSYSTGLIKEINDKEITHNAATIVGASGSPIFLENSIKVIGIHKQGNKFKEENYGNFIYPIIQELQNNNINIIRNKSINKEEYNKYNYNDGKYYIGPILNKLPNGKGKIYYKNGNLYYEGDIKNGIKEGNGKIFLENGEYYYGQFTNGQITGKGKYYYDNGDYYEGDLVNGLRHGKGKYYWKNGEIYEGDYVNGNKEGYGKDIYSDGNYYVGFYLKNLRHGKGKQFYKNGTLKSDIDFVNDKFEGYGRYNYEDGEYYVGQFHNGLKHGKGKAQYKDGNLAYDGEFVKDLKEGYGRYNYLNGEYYIGQWSQGQKHGKGILYNANGTIKYDGLFFNDKFEG